MNHTAFSPAVVASSSYFRSSPVFGGVRVLDLASLLNMWWYVIVILIFIFLMICDMEHLLICRFSIYISSMMRCPLKSLAHFLTGLSSYCSDMSPVNILVTALISPIVLCMLNPSAVSDSLRPREL